MKAIAIFLVLIFGTLNIAFAQSNHTITIDGTNDFNSTNENLGSEAGRTAYVTWNSSSLFIGIEGNPLVATLSNLYIVINNDPVWDDDPRSGNGRSDQPTSDGQGATYPFNADVVFCFYGSNSDDGSVQNPAPGDKYTVSGGSWSGSSISSGVKIIRKTSSCTEIEIPFSETGINSSAEFHVIVYAANQSSPTANNFAQWPTGNSNGGNPTLKDFYSYTRESGINPNSGYYYSFRDDQAGYSIGGSYFGSIYFVPSSSQTYYCNALIGLGRHLFIGSNATFSMGSNAANLVIDGNLCNKGTLVFSTNSSPGEIQLKSHFKNTGSITHNSVGLEFIGSIEQFFYGRAALYDLLLNNSGTSGGLTIVDTVWCSNNATITDGTLKINPQAGLKVTGTLSNSQGTSGIVIESDATGTGALIHQTASVSGTVKRYVTGSDRYHYLSSPISNATIANILVSYNVYKYDETNTNIDLDIGWTRVFSANNMTNGLGYASPYASSTTLNFAGTLNQGNITLSNVTHTPAGTPPPGKPASEGWNLIGNPYPSPIRYTPFISANTNIWGALYFWDDPDITSYNRSTDYAVKNASGGVAASQGSVNMAPNDTIAVGQGFFVKRDSSATSTISFTNAMRSYKSNNPQFFIVNDNEIQRIYVSISGEKKEYNQTLIAFCTEASKKTDRLYDAIKLKGNPWISLYSTAENEDFAIQGRSPLLTHDTILIGYDVKEAGLYTLKVEETQHFPDQVQVYLEDKKFNSFMKLGNRSYTFYSQAGIYRNRFVLHILPESEIFEPVMTTPFYIFGDGNKVIIKNKLAYKEVKAEITIYDILGNEVFKTNTCIFDEIHLKPILKSGNYIVKASSKDGFNINNIVLIKN